MSVSGTGIAAAAAQAAHTAQKVGRSQDKNKADRTHAQDREADLFVHRLQAASEADDPDAELPDHQAPGYEQLYLYDAEGEPLADPLAPLAPDEQAPASHAPPPAPVEGTLYHHIDIEA